MTAQKWFNRQFDLGLPQEALPWVVERVRGTPARLEERVKGLPTAVLTTSRDDSWSIQENVGHLLDLEPLWAGRLEDLVEGRPELRPADLTNEATWDAQHNRRALGELLSRFRAARSATVERLEFLDSEVAHRTAQHPRLKKLMSVVDLFFFVAEHDDHHLALITEMMRAISDGDAIETPRTIDRAVLRRAVSAASAAHHEYEQNALAGARDEMWAGWYAAYILGRMGDFMEPTKLSELLRRVPVTNDWPGEAAGLIERHMERTNS